MKRVRPPEIGTAKRWNNLRENSEAMNNTGGGFSTSNYPYLPVILVPSVVNAFNSI